MADLKVGTTVGGSPVWHQGNLALVPSGNAILYKGARIYSENDKPSANELQVVSRAGDTMTGMLNVETSTEYPLALKSSVSGPAYIRFSKGNTLQSYVGTDAAGDFKVAMTDVNGSWAFDGLKIAKSNGDVSLKGALVSANTGNFDIKYGSVQFIRANSAKDLYIGAPGGTDLVLGYAQDGMTTTKIRFDSAVYNKTGGLLISNTGLIQRSAMDNPYYNQTESDARFIRLNVNTVTNGYLLSKSSDMGTPHNLSMGYSGFFRHNGLGGFRGLTINVSHPDQSNGAHARGITFDYGSTGYGMYTYAYDGSGTRLANQKIYTEADKPTPAEIGALAAGANAVSASKLQTARTISLTGGATGSVSFDGSANASLAVTITNNSHTHSDYVEKTGDTMSGNLTVPKVLLSAAQGAEANSVARRDFVESTVTASGKGVKDLTIALPAGAPTTGYIPVLFKTYGTSNSFVFIDTLPRSESHPMNNCSFLGNVRAGGWSDGGSYAYGQFTIYSTSERAIHSIHGPAEAIDGFVVYVETRAFPIRVRVDIGTAVTAYATDVSYGTSVFKVNGQVSGNTKTIVLANFDKGSGTYNGSNRVYDTGYNPTPEAVGALPANGNAVTASRLQTARLIAGVPFDGTSNISISATNVGLGNLANYEWNYSAVANTYAVRDESGDLQARLLRTTFADESGMSGAIAYRANNSTDNYTRYCSNPSAIRDWMRGAKTSWDMGWRAYIEDPNSPMTEYHIPGRAGVITYLSDDGTYLIASSKGTGSDTYQRARFDTSGNFSTAGAVYEANQRVYSPNNPQKLTQDGSGLGGTSVTFSTVGKTMAVAYLAAYNKVYPVTFAIASAVRHGVKIPNRGGENADKDYDLQVAVSVSGNNMTLTTIAGNRCNGIWQVYTM